MVALWDVTEVKEYTTPLQTGFKTFGQYAWESELFEISHISGNFYLIARNVQMIEM